LTSRKKQEQDNLREPWETTFRDYWNINISAQDPPDTEFIIVGTESSGHLPIHDRWWLTKDAGLRMGTSLNSLGEAKSSDIIVLSSEQTDKYYREIEQYINGIKQMHNKEKLLYTSFNLCNKNDN
jgi:hypothetical protein